MTASVYDAVAADSHASVDAEIVAALEGMPTDGGPVVDIGAGTGLTTAVIAATLPSAEILAVEPDPAMRAALVTRVYADVGLRRRVSILPVGILEAPLGDALSGAVASASLVHFSPVDRMHLWASLAKRLSPTGRIIVEVQCPKAIDVPRSMVAASRIGRVSYEAWAEARSIGSDRQQWSLTYRTILDNVMLDEQRVDHICWTIDGAEILNETSGKGLVGHQIGNLVVLRKSP